ncbi:hypothetical protein MKW92_026685 [Papaver armeniacum]|nr:hypothetical protein MKW92_026685 [Papaver armeniacum]
MALWIDTVNRFLSKLGLIFGMRLPFVFDMKLWVFAIIGIIVLLILLTCCCIGCRKSPRYRAVSYPKNQNLQKKVNSLPYVPQVHIDIDKTEHPLAKFSQPLEISPLGWRLHQFTSREISAATDIFSNDNMIGEGQHGVVYRGVLRDGTWVTVKRFDHGNANEFIAEIQALRRVRHKNCITLLGYCLDGSSKMLVYEYVNNDNLHQWLHMGVMQYSPLTWDMRLDIMIGIAKALSYLHEGLEQKIVHRDIKSCNVLLDNHWNPKVADFGVSRILDSYKSQVETRVIGTYGYVAPEYACTGILNDRSDVYSFGVLVMEIVSGRSPSSFSESSEEMSLVDWFKKLIETQRFNETGDPKMPYQPSSKALKNVLLVALRCVDPDAKQRPKMSQIVHMLENTDRFRYHEKKHKTTQEA